MTLQLPKARESVVVCILCVDWQVDVAPRAVAQWGDSSAIWGVIGQVHIDHVHEAHPDALAAATPGEMMSGAMVHPLPRWWVHR